MNTTYSGVSPLVAALNDVARTRIGNPWRGTYHVSVATDDAHEATALAETLDKLGIGFQANYRRDETGRPDSVWLAMYDLRSQQRLLNTCGSELDEPRRLMLELVRARGPVPAEILRRIHVTARRGESYAYIAERMNELRIVDGMGGRGWTAKKVEAKHETYLEQRTSEPLHSSEDRSSA